jgi:hypothetical protein
MDGEKECHMDAFDNCRVNAQSRGFAALVNGCETAADL